jgi:hypothetical protein
MNVVMASKATAGAAKESASSARNTSAFFVELCSWSASAWLRFSFIRTRGPAGLPGCYLPKKRSLHGNPTANRKHRLVGPALHHRCRPEAATGQVVHRQSCACWSASQCSDAYTSVGMNLSQSGGAAVPAHAAQPCCRVAMPRIKPFRGRGGGQRKYGTANNLDWSETATPRSVLQGLLPFASRSRMGTVGQQRTSTDPLPTHGNYRRKAQGNGRLPCRAAQSVHVSCRKR